MYYSESGDTTVDIYMEMIEYVVQARKGALPLETLKGALRTLRKKHPNLIYITLDKRFKIISMMPDTKESVLAAKAYLEELHRSLCLLTNEKIAHHIIVNPSLEFLSERKKKALKSDLLNNLPDFLAEEVNRFWGRGSSK